MSFNFVKKLPTPAEIREQYPVSNAIIQVKKERDEMIRKVFTGESDKFLVIIGPCSADNEDAVLDYVHRLARVLLVKAIRAWFTSQTLRKNRIC